MESSFLGGKSVEYERWAPWYDRIRADFGFEFDREVMSSNELLALLPEPSRTDPLGRLAARISGRDAIIVGLAPGGGAPPLWKLHRPPPPSAIIAADGATERCLAAGLVPEIVVTDLDGPVGPEVSANSRGSLVVIHAHGDNVDAVREWTPQFPGELAGSWAGPPRDGLLNVGGFTDGDRAVFLAHHLGARRILLFGFDFVRVEGPTEARAALKRKKLRWAERLIDLLANQGPVPILRLGPDGSESPYGNAGGGPLTQ